MTRSKYTLHEAIRLVLLEVPDQTASTEHICSEIIRQGLYKQKEGGDPFPDQIRLRAMNYIEMFELVDKNTVCLKS